MDQSVAPSENKFRNHILSALPPDEITRLHPLLTRVRWVSGQGLYEPGEHIEQVFFPEQGFASMVAEAEDGGSQVEVGIVGRESMVGLSVLLNANATSFNRVMVQLPGVAYRLPARVLRDDTDAMPVLRQRLFRALEESLAQVSQTAACNSRHTLPERLARWLLIAHDRADGDELALTQEFLSFMLAVRRAGVTIAVAFLEAKGLIEHSRGQLLICDRPGLEAAACDCYGRVKTFVEGLAARNS